MAPLHRGLLVLVVSCLLLCNFGEGGKVKLQNANRKRTIGPRQCTNCGGSGGNDDCTGAVPLSIGKRVLGDISGASCDANAAFSSQYVTKIRSPGVWYTFIGNGHRLQLSTCNPTYTSDTEINIWEADPESRCPYADPLTGEWTPVAGSEDSNGQCEYNAYAAQTSFCSKPGQKYSVLVSMYTFLPTDDTAFSLTLTDLGECEPAPNANPRNAITVRIGQEVQGNNLQTPVQQLTQCCTDCSWFTDTAFVRPVWYHVVGNGDQMTLDFRPWENTQTDLAVSVYKGNPGTTPQSCVTGWDDEAYATFITPVVSWVSEYAVDYYIAVYTWNGMPGADFGFRVSSKSICRPSPAPPVIVLNNAEVVGPNQMKLTYDLSDPDSVTLDVTVHVLLNGQDEAIQITQGLSGQVGTGIVTGNGKSLIWTGALAGNYQIFLGAFDGDNLVYSNRLSINAVFPPGGEVPKKSCGDAIPYHPNESACAAINLRD